MEANILEGIYVRVGGEAGRTNGLSLNVLDNMFSHLQELVLLLAKYELETGGSPNLKEFEIELFDFKPGSAIPAFRVIPQRQRELIPIVEEQRGVVAKKFDDLMALANTGKYEDFFPVDGLIDVKYAIAEEMHGFIASAGNSPVSIVRPINGNGQFREIYNVHKFTKIQSEQLLRPRKRKQKAEDPELILGLVQRIGGRKRIIDLYENKDATISVTPVEIILENKTYHLHSPLNCTVIKEDEHFIIQNEILDLYAVGDTIDEAEHDLYSEFDASYTLLNSMPDDQLSDRLLRAKNMLNGYIKEITRE